MDRRTLLRRAALLGAVGLAGCAGDGTSDGPGQTTGDGAGATPSTTPATAGTTGGTTMETATEEPTDSTATSAETTDESTTGTAEPTASDPREAVTVTVGAGGKARLDPESFTLASGGTVTWEWAQGGHNVLVDSQPEGGGFENSPAGSRRRTTPGSPTRSRSTRPASTATTAASTGASA